MTSATSDSDAPRGDVTRGDAARGADVRTGWRGFTLPELLVVMAIIAILMGLWFNMTGLLWVGIIFFALMVLFSLLTLPVEIDASRRGTALLQEAGLMQHEADAKGARAVLTAAALTYLAAAVTSILQLLYYISIARRRG